MWECHGPTRSNRIQHINPRRAADTYAVPIRHSHTAADERDFVSDQAGCSTRVVGSKAGQNDQFRAMLQCWSPIAIPTTKEHGVLEMMKAPLRPGTRDSTRRRCNARSRRHVVDRRACSRRHPGGDFFIIVPKGLGSQSERSFAGYDPITFTYINSDPVSTIVQTLSVHLSVCLSDARG